MAGLIASAIPYWVMEMEKFGSNSFTRSGKPTVCTLIGLGAYTPQKMQIGRDILRARPATMAINKGRIVRFKAPLRWANRIIY